LYTTNFRVLDKFKSEPLNCKNDFSAHFIYMRSRQPHFSVFSAFQLSRVFFSLSFFFGFFVGCLYADCVSAATCVSMKLLGSLRAGWAWVVCSVTCQIDLVGFILEARPGPLPEGIIIGYTNGQAQQTPALMAN
jgi:hypothetical protein